MRKSGVKQLGLVLNTTSVKHSLDLLGGPGDKQQDLGLLGKMAKHKAWARYGISWPNNSLYFHKVRSKQNLGFIISRKLNKEGSCLGRMVKRRFILTGGI